MGAGSKRYKTMSTTGSYKKFSPPPAVSACTPFKKTEPACQSDPQLASIKKELTLCFSLIFFTNGFVANKINIFNPKIWSQLSLLFNFNF